MERRNNNRKGYSKYRSNKAKDSVEQEFLFTRNVSWSAASVATFLTLDATALTSVCGTFGAFADMYRFYRIKKIKIKCGPELNATVSEYYLLTFFPEGTTAPTAFGDVEGLTTSDFAINKGGAFNSVATLSIEEDALRTVTSGHWMVTSNDASDTFLESYGDVYMISGASNSAGLLATVRMIVEFKELVDPGTISKRLKIKDSATPKVIERVSFPPP